ncbi:hypothetical protein [Terriglobus roseus]|uniref:DUF2946 domain-containing protein n=1 Tax=Terriglobus roseus TaxID=392734 RepID=A0A1G7KF67_9BACT|nr:hypothetical protein [Terriglobus roseus]SDF35701.1 hypothetical protein SAMN05444167_2159 [Terriglobus roseus]
MMAELQIASGTTRFQRVCAVLCLFLLLFSVAHTVFGHSEVLRAPQVGATGSSDNSVLHALTTDTPDTCALCVAITTIVVMAVLTLGAPRPSRPRTPVLLQLSGTVTGWHPSLFSRPPPAR